MKAALTRMRKSSSNASRSSAASKRPASPACSSAGCGWATAGQRRIMDELENRGIVGPSNGAEPRDILIDLDGEGHDGGGQEAV